MKKQLKCALNPDKFSDFVSVISDLSKIDDSIKLKISEDKTMVYSLDGGNNNIILAFKNYLLKTEDIFVGLDVEEDIDLIIPNSKKFVKNLGFFDTKEKISVVLNVKPMSDGGLEARSIQITNKKLKINWMAAEQYTVKDIPYKSLVKLLDLDNKKLSFNIDRKDFDDVKKLANINGSTLIEVSSDQDGVITMSEQSSWELEVDKIESSERLNYNVNKKFLSSVNDGTEPVNFHLFPNFLLVKDDTCNLMVSFEQSY